MKKIKTLALALACIIVLTLSLTSCDFLKYGFFDEEGNFVGLDNFFNKDNSEEDVNIEISNLSAYNLEYVSNGDGTCTVFIRSNENASFYKVGAYTTFSEQKSDAIYSEKVYSYDGNQAIIMNPSEGISGNYFVTSSMTSVEIPAISPDGDTVTAVGDSGFTAYSNVPRILDTETYENILNELRSGKNGETIGEFEFNKFKSFYVLHDPSNTPSSIFVTEMNKKYPVTKVMSVYALDDAVALSELEWLSETLEQYAGYTSSDYKSDFYNLKSKVSQEDGQLAETLEYGNFADNITRVALPYTVVKIASNAFAGCYNMEHIEINSDIEELGDYAFKDCKKLQNVHLHNGGLTRIGAGVFMNCENLRNISLPETVTEIGMKAFYGCTRLDSVDIPSTLQSIGNEAFFGCSSLGGIYIPYATTFIGANAFAECESLFSADFECTDGWVRTNGASSENFSFSDSATNASYLKDADCEYTRVSR